MTKEEDNKQEVIDFLHKLENDLIEFISKNEYSIKESLALNEQFYSEIFNTLMFTQYNLIENPDEEKFIKTVLDMIDDSIDRRIDFLKSNFEESFRKCEKQIRKANDK